jgi:hypothetical protein
VESQHADLHAGDYHLIGVDLRQVREFEQKLATAYLDRTQPTLIIAECVLVYMDEQHSQELIEEFARFFETVAILNYEQAKIFFCYFYFLKYFFISGQHGGYVQQSDAGQSEQPGHFITRLVRL